MSIAFSLPGSDLCTIGLCVGYGFVPHTKYVNETIVDKV